MQIKLFCAKFAVVSNGLLINYKLSPITCIQSKILLNICGASSFIRVQSKILHRLARKTSLALKIYVLLELLHIIHMTGSSLWDVVKFRGPVMERSHRVSNLGRVTGIHICLNKARLIGSRSYGNAPGVCDKTSSAV